MQIDTGAAASFIGENLHLRCFSRLPLSPEKLFFGSVRVNKHQGGI
jgi:hypothetical protein